MPLDRRCSSWRSGCGRRMCEGEKAERLELSYLIWLSERSEIKYKYQDGAPKFDANEAREGLH